MTVTCNRVCQKKSTLLTACETGNKITILAFSQILVEYDAVSTMVFTLWLQVCLTALTPDRGACESLCEQMQLRCSSKQQVNIKTSLWN